MSYILMFANFWFVCFCFTIMTIPKKYMGSIDSAIISHSFDRTTFTLIELCIYWPLLWFFTYERYKDEQNRQKELAEIDNMFIQRFVDNENYYKSERVKL